MCGFVADHTLSPFQWVLARLMIWLVVLRAAKRSFISGFVPYFSGSITMSSMDGRGEDDEDEGSGNAEMDGTYELQT
jgi:hypothetical protein